jgi:hypothetical protein
MRRPHDPGMKHGKSPSTSFHNNNENHESNDATTSSCGGGSSIQRPGNSRSLALTNRTSRQPRTNCSSNFYLFTSLDDTHFAHWFIGGISCGFRLIVHHGFNTGTSGMIWMAINPRYPALRDWGKQQMDHTPHGGFFFLLVATIPKSTCSLFTSNHLFPIS